MCNETNTLAYQLICLLLLSKTMVKFPRGEFHWDSINLSPTISYTLRK